MRLNKYIAASSDLSRRAADDAIAQNRVRVNGQVPVTGQQVTSKDTVTLDGRVITPAVNTITIMLHKPVGYVCSRDGQGSPTVFELLPPQYRSLQTVGRLDKDSSGLLLLTNDGALANDLTHPSRGKQKAYTVTLNKPLAPADEARLQTGVVVEGYTSHLTLDQPQYNRITWRVRMTTGRNRQIRKTFDMVGYRVTGLRRTAFGDYSLDGLAVAAVRSVDA